VIDVVGALSLQRDGPVAVHEPGRRAGSSRGLSDALC
jgi:hypothetical protein